MAETSARQRIVEAPPSFVAPLEGEKAARFKADSMLIPSPAQIRDAIAAIPCGSSKTVLELRQELAQACNAGVTCPFAMSVGWRLVAHAAEEDRAEGSTEVTPWWRLTRDKKPDPKMPGGIENHRSLLAKEGIAV